MSKHLKLKPAIVILILVNVFLITLYHNTQINKRTEIANDDLILEITNEHDAEGSENTFYDVNKDNASILEEHNEIEGNVKEIKNEVEKTNEDKNIVVENEKDNKTNNNIKFADILNDNIKFIQDNVKMKEKSYIDNKNIFLWDKKKELLNKMKNNSKNSKEKEKDKSNNGVDDTNEFRSLKPFYGNVTQRKILEEYYNPNKLFWKEMDFGQFPVSSLDNISNRTEYKILKNKLYEEAIQSLNNEFAEQNKKMSYDDERELRFLLKYAKDVENGLRHDELEPEWQWAADISIVYTWVNGSDPIHLEQKAKYNGGIKKVDNRDRCTDELRFSLRSLFKNLPWHKGKIFIVTPGQTPEWLDPEFDRIQIINQEDILPKKDMNGNDVNPTFNTFAIEWFLDRIPGLTEQFIQLNDDYFFRQPVHPAYFFYGSGESYNFDKQYILYYNKIQDLKNLYPYYYHTFYKNSKQYKMISGLNYYTYLNKKYKATEFYPCLLQILDNLKEKKSYELVNHEHMQCISSAMMNIDKYENDYNNDTNNNNIDSNNNIDNNNNNIDNNSNIINNNNYQNNDNANSNNEYNNNIDSNNTNINQSIFEVDEVENADDKIIVQNNLREEEENIEEIEEEELQSSKREDKNIQENNEEEFQNSKRDNEEKYEEELQYSNHTKRYLKTQERKIFYPNAAQHFRFPNIYLALHFLINDIKYAKNVGKLPFSKTTMNERFIASLGMTNGAIKSMYGRGKRINQLEHSPYVWYRDLFPMSREKFKEYIDITLTHKFRHPEDVIPPFANQAYLRYTASKKGFENEFDRFYSSKYIHDLDEEVKGSNNEIKRNRTILKYGFHIVENNLREKTMRFGQIYDDATKNINLYIDVIRENYLFFNFNDDYSEPRVSQELHEIMEFLYPDKGIFEK